MSSQAQSMSFGTLQETAAYWAMRLASPECGPADRAAFEAWRGADPLHAEAYDRAARGLSVVDRHLSDPALMALGEQVMAETAPRSTVRQSWVAAGIAAAVILAVGLTLFRFMTAAPPPIEAYETAIGERSTIVLADGSTVTLNTNSYVQVDVTDAQRDIALLRGQALFEVAKDANRPFVVTAGNQRITALGTAFDVRLDEDVGVQVVLVEGRVSVDEVVRDRPEPAAASRVELAPGERLIAEVNGRPAIEKTDIEEATSWRGGRLVFRDKPLAEAVAEVNRYSTDQVVLGNDPRLGEIRVSGVFNTGRTASFVLALESMHPLDAQRTAQDRTTLTWRETQD